MSSQRFWRAAAIQGALVGVLFVALALALDDEFFEDYGIVVGPLIWAGCSLITGRLLKLPIGFTLFCALAGAVAGIVVDLAAPHQAAVGLGDSLGEELRTSVDGLDPEHDSAAAEVAAAVAFYLSTKPSGGSSDEATIREAVRVRWGGDVPANVADWLAAQGVDA